MNTSTYEEKIIKLLKGAKISFKREQSFKDLRNGSFKYDFYIPKDKVLIEVDGEQHFIFIEFFHKTPKGLLKQKEYDRRKNSYALAAGYKLYRIPFWEVENLSSAADIFQEKFLVKKRDHNDYLRIPYNNQ